MRKRLKQYRKDIDAKLFMKTWSKYRYWVETVPKSYPNIEVYAKQVVGSKWDLQESERNRPNNSKFESWDTLIDSPIFACRRERLAIKINARFGKHIV